MTTFTGIFAALLIVAAVLALLSARRNARQPHGVLIPNKVLLQHRRSADIDLAKPIEPARTPDSPL